MSPLAPPVPPVPGPWAVEPFIQHLAQGEPALVALSGGVDSAVVAALLVRALGPRARAVTLTGPAVSEREADRAVRVAHYLGIPHALVAVDPIVSPGYRSNPSNRCYFCRQVETRVLAEWGLAHGVRRFLDGVHRDDLAEERPGLRAMAEAGFVHPLAEAGWGKAEVRTFALAIGLPNADEPSDACLASRVRPGQSISAELLRRVERAEDGLHARGFRRVRVRVEGEGARVEVDPSETPRLLTEPTASEVRAELARLGFAPVSLDPLGYHGGRNP